MDDPTSTTTLPALDGSTDIAAWVRAAAEQHGVTATPGPLDGFVAEASRLSDAEARLDPIEELLLALGRDGVLTGTQDVLLHAAYLRQRADRFAKGQGLIAHNPTRTETRRNALDSAIAASRIEGGEPTPADVDVIDQWATGAIEMEEVIARLRATHARS